MQFITTGNRIAVENFTIGDLYTITFTNGNYINSACIGIGGNFVTFQRNEPELLFSLTMETAELVSTIDLYAGGTGTTNYNELTNKPQIGGVELVGNKSLAAFGIQPEITEESPLSSALVSGLGSAAAAESSDFATAAQGALAASAIQSAGSGLSKDGTTLNHSNSVTAKTSEGFAAITYDAQGHITGSTAATTAQLAALNSGVTSTDVAQIETNKNNISYNINNGVKNLSRWNSGTSSQAYPTMASQIPFVSDGGEYTISYNTALTTGSISIGFKDSGGTATATVEIGNESKIKTVTIPANTAYFNIYTLAYGDYSNFMICKKAIYDADPTYQPYAMSNVELTAAIQALQAQLANQ